MLITTALLAPALSQSGRGRPKVPQPSPTTTTQPQPINIPATAAVIKQEQAGTTSRFLLRNGITVVISEHHATPIAAVVAYFKATANDDSWAMSSTAQLLAGDFRSPDLEGRGGGELTRTWPDSFAHRERGKINGIRPKSGAS